LSWLPSAGQVSPKAVALANHEVLWQLTWKLWESWESHHSRCASSPHRQIAVLAQLRATRRCELKIELAVQRRPGIAKGRRTGQPRDTLAACIRSLGCAHSRSIPATSRQVEACIVDRLLFVAVRHCLCWAMAWKRALSTVCYLWPFAIASCWAGPWLPASFFPHFAQATEVVVFVSALA
jgi:hypothetical protein